MNFILLLLFGTIQLTETTFLSGDVLMVVQCILALTLGFRLVSGRKFLNGNVMLSRDQLIIFAVILFLFIYPVLHIGSSPGVLQYGFSALLPPIFLIVGAFISGNISEENLWVFLYFGYLSLVIMILTGGLDFPYLNFTAKDRMYSQGVSIFYGLQVLATVALLGNRQSLTKKSLLILSVLVFIILSVLGGGRGEIIILILVCFVWFLLRSPLTAMPILLSVGLVVAGILFQFQEDIVLLSRFERLILDQDNIRLDLWRDAFDLILNSPNCLLFGCGSGYFELMTKQERYPHNLFIEYLISAGLFPSIIFAVLLSLIFYQIVKMRKLPSEQVFIPLAFIFVFGLGMKSTTFNTNFLFWLLLFFSVRQIRVIKRYVL